MMACGIRTAMDDTAYVYGTKGSITIPRFWSPEQVTVRTDEGTETFDFPVGQKIEGMRDEGYQYELRHVNDCIRKGLRESPVVTFERTIRVLEQCDRLRAD